MAMTNLQPSDIADVWRAAPDIYAHYISGGRWKLYKHITYAARIIQEAILRGNGRIILTMPPRHGKTAFVSHWIPTWFLDCWPEKRVILTSYGDSLARSAGRWVRNTIIGGTGVTVKLRPDSHSATEFETEAGGGLFATGMGGAITGRGCDLLCIDDPIKTIKEAMSETIRNGHIDWFRTIAYTRLEPGATIIVCQTRWHERDLSGWLINEHDDRWNVINLPAIAEENDALGRNIGNALWPQRYDIDALNVIRKSLGERFFSALYQGRPSPVEGSIWKNQYWKRWDVIPNVFDEVVQSWDTTVKEGGSSFVVGQIWGRVGASRYLLDQVRGKWGFTELLLKFRQLCAKWPVASRKLVENKANGPALQDQLSKEIPGIILVEPEGGKEVRAMAAEPELEAGNIFLPSNEVMYPWIVGFINEASMFPNGENDDQVDAASQALNFFRSHGQPAYGGKERNRVFKRMRMQ